LVSKRPRKQADKKLALFRQILLDLGAGAKTNVGFGRFCGSEPRTRNGGAKRGVERTNRRKATANASIAEKRPKRQKTANIIPPARVQEQAR
jgi:hypothetical protein